MSTTTKVAALFGATISVTSSLAYVYAENHFVGFTAALAQTAGYISAPGMILGVFVGGAVIGNAHAGGPFWTVLTIAVVVNSFIYAIPFYLFGRLFARTGGSDN